ncbi:MAG TPA: LuxR C-terminal-related transcriptional regulator [Solirubrobacteraceae bacterium]|nr:LuxR C-terminal-related transcriptional regulator [Solirubrobacteraceae bacterium]
MSLSADDLAAVLELSLEAQRSKDMAELRGVLVPGLRRLVACETLALNEIDLARASAWTLHDPPDCLFEGIGERFLALAHQHPLVALQRAGDLRTYALSDFLSRRRLHHLELYQDIYRPIGLEDQLVFGLPGDVLVALVLGRDRRTFTERDRAVLEALRPHLACAYTQVRARQHAAALVAALDSALAQRDAAFIQLDSAWRVAHASATARELLEAYLGRPWAECAELPSPIMAAVRGASGKTLHLEGPRGRLRVLILPSAGRDACTTLLLEEQRSRPPSVESLRELGITRRQAQVLRLLTLGRTNDQIAHELSISVGTIRKHLEHIYARLGVSSRTQAIARIRA